MLKKDKKDKFETLAYVLLFAGCFGVTFGLVEVLEATGLLLLSLIVSLCVESFFVVFLSFLFFGWNNSLKLKQVRSINKEFFEQLTKIQNNGFDFEKEIETPPEDSGGET